MARHPRNARETRQPATPKDARTPPRKNTRAKRADTKRWSLNPGTISELLARKQTNLSCTLITEPLLAFADKQTCEDPKTGLAAFGPYSKTDATRRPIVRLGIVGPAEAVDRALHFIETIGRPVPHDPRNDAIIHPGFPGINDQEPFQIQFVTQPVWCKTLTPATIATIENHPNFTVRVHLLTQAVAKEVEAITKLDTPPDVVIVAMTARIEERCRVGIAAHDATHRHDHEDDDDLPDVIEEVDNDETPDTEEPVGSARSFRRGLKAACMHQLPTQLVWHRTLAGTKGVQDLATRAWNITVALLYKARIIPWRLAEPQEGSCYVGISFFHPDENNTTLRTSMAQAFTHDGEGFVLQGDKFTWNPRNENDKAPHLSRDAAKALLERVLHLYDDEAHGTPQRVTVHKTSRYTTEEREGFADALKGVGRYALVTLSRRGICALRPGNKPVLRGTAMDFGNRQGLVYTTGYVPFLRCYPGFRIPQPLEVSENWGSFTFREVAADLLRLTKLNWNTAAFACVDPITIAFSRRVGDILRIANTDNPAPHYRQYM